MKTPFREAHGGFSFATWDEPPTREEALRFLQGLARTGDGMRNLRRVLWELGGAESPAELDDHEVIDRLASRLATATYRVWETPAVMPDVSIRRSEEEEEPEPEPVPEPPKHWIEFRVVDNETGDPVGGVTLSLKVPGTVVGANVSTRDTNGVGRLDDLDGGTVDVLSVAVAKDMELVEIS